MTTEIDRLIPSTETIRLPVSGLEVRLHRLRTLELFAALRILSRGAGPAIGNIDLNAEEEELVAQVVALMVFAIPEADHEVLGFFQAMTEPEGVVKGRRLDPETSERNRKLKDVYAEVMANPEIEDLVVLLEAIVNQEADDVVGLGKRLTVLFRAMAKKAMIGQKKEDLGSPSQTSTLNGSSASSQEDSLEPLT